MATPAQVRANRANAQKSTGPRTAEGKAVVAQNAVKHGLLAREGVLRGEDREEFEQHREALLEELNPAEALEVMLAARVVDLTWRLRRAAQNQNETLGALYDRHTAGAPEPAGATERGAILGRMILEDYSGEAVLERLLRCERRIEGSFFRNLHELRRVHDQQSKADAEAAGTLTRSSRDLRTGWRDEDDQARQTRAFAPWGPEEMCQTNPIGSAPRDRGAPFVRTEHGQDAHATGGRDAHTELMDLAGPDTPGEQSCQTNPIGPEPDARQLLGGTAVMSVSASEGLRKTNPMGSASRGTGIPPVGPNHGQDTHITASPGVASAEPGGNGANPPPDQGRFATCKYAKTG